MEDRAARIMLGVLAVLIVGGAGLFVAGHQFGYTIMASGILASVAWYLIACWRSNGDGHDADALPTAPATTTEATR